MPTNVMAMLQSLSRAQIERLLKAKERIEALQNRREELRGELAQIESALGGLLAGTGDVAKTERGARKSAKKKSAKKKTAKKPTAKKATAKKAATKKASPKAPARKKAGKKKAAPAGRGAAVKAAKAGKPARATLEDVVYSVIEKRGEPVPFQVLIKTITSKKLFKTRSSNFDNVLRRTLSTSRRIKRVGRGLYGI